MTQTEEVTTGNPKSKNFASKKFANKNKGKKLSRVQRPMQNKSLPLIRCNFCHKTHPRKKEPCPAWQRKCSQCGGMNHFPVACSSLKASKQHNTNRVHSIEQEFLDGGADSDDDYLFSIESVGTLHVKNSPKKLYANMCLRDETVQFQLDCGTVNILPADIYQKVYDDPNMTRLQKTQTTLVMLNKSELKPLGYIKVETLNPKNEQCFLTEYTIVPNGHTALLGAQSIQQFGLITVNTDNIMSVSDAIPAQPDVVSEFEDVFSGEGKLPDKLHLEIDKSVPPVVLPVRKVPFAVQEPLRQELERLVTKGILEPVDISTDWVSSMVVVKKANRKMRLCIDPKSLNQALRRNYYPLPVIDDLLPQLRNTKVFSVVDAKNSFWHVKLDEESSLLTTFGTPRGQYR